METSLNQAQHSYLQSLLSSLSASSIQCSQKVSVQTRKQQMQIQLGQLRINESPQQLQSQLGTKQNIGKEAIEGRESRSMTQNNERLMSNEQHARILKQILMKKKKLDKRKEARRKEQEEELEKEEEENRARLEEDKLERQLEKKKKLEEKINEILLYKQRRESEGKIQNMAIGRLLNERKLYEKFQNKYLLEEAASLEQKKKRLAEIRSLHKPVTKEELMEHERKIDEMREKIPKKEPVTLSSSLSTNVYKSNFYKKASLESKEKLLEAEREKEDKFQSAYEAKEKIKEYYRYVQNNFKPQIDEKLGEIVGPATAEVRKPLDFTQLKKVGDEYLKHNLKHKKNKLSSEQAGTSDASSKEFAVRPKHPMKSISMHVLPKAERYPDYLHEQKSLRSNEGNQVQALYLKKQRQSLQKKRSQSQLDENSRSPPRRRRGESKEMLNEEDLDVLYEKIIKVKEAINEKN